VKSELLTREKRHVDLKGGWLKLDDGEGKTRDARRFPLTPELRGVLEQQLAWSREIEKARGIVIARLFHHPDGTPIKDFRSAWSLACKRAGLVGRIPHDFRRSAVRNLERSHAARSAAMKMVGHRTESIYRRYAIADDSMLQDAALQLSVLHQADAALPAKVPTPISGKASA
jgi:integrase